MTHYSVQPRNWIFVKGYEFLSFFKKMSKSIGKNISKNVSIKYGQELLDHAKKSATIALKAASENAIQKTAKTTGELIGNKFVDEIIKVSRILPQNNSKTAESGAEILKERLYLHKK